MDTPILSVDGLGKDFYLHEQQKRVPSAHNVSFAAYPGQLTALVGSTGAGKSTVLKIIYRTYLPRCGAIIFRRANGSEVDLATVDEHGILQLRKREIGFVTQFFQPLPRQKSLDVVAQPLLGLGQEPEAARATAAGLLARLNIPENLWNIPPATFSGGEKQRVNLARGIIARPRLLMLDEPTASLDRNTIDKVVGIIRELKSDGCALLAIFHDQRLVDELADHTVTIAPAAGSQS